MTNIAKRQATIRKVVTLGKVYSFEEAIDLMQNKLPKSKFIESVDVSINLGIDARKSDQVVRGATVLPNGTGKTVRVAVFTQGANVAAAQAAGADLVGMDELAQSIQAGNMDFDVVIASPDAMGIVGRLGPVLGPRGLMPNPKVGTVTMDVAQAVKNAKGGQVRFRADKSGIVHTTIGKINFAPEALKENLASLLLDVRKAKPSSSKGTYFRKLTLSTTHGAGLTVDLSSVIVI